MRNKITHQYSFFRVLRCLGTRWLFWRCILTKPSCILFLLTIKIFKDDGNVLANVTSPYKTLLLVKFNVWVTAGTRHLWRHSAKRYWVTYCCDHRFQKLSANFWRFLQEWRRFFREKRPSTYSDFKVTDWKDRPMIISTEVSRSGLLVSLMQCVKGRLFICASTT